MFRCDCMIGGRRWSERKLREALDSRRRSMSPPNFWEAKAVRVEAETPALHYYSRFSDYSVDLYPVS